MELWKKGLYVSLFSSLLWDQQAVGVAVGLHGRPDAQRPEERIAPPQTGPLFAPLRTAAATALAEKTRAAIAEFKANDPWQRFKPPAPLTSHGGEEEDGMLSRSEAEGELYQEIKAELIAQAQLEVERRAIEQRRVTLASRGDVVPVTRPTASNVDADPSANHGGNAHVGTDVAQPAPDRRDQPSGTSQPAPKLAEEPGISPTQTGSVVTIALRHQGVPYLYGGTTPQGFDCSGFIQYVMKQAGITVPRTTYQQINAGPGVSKGDLRPGDLVFFSPGGGTTGHAGIYIGNGQFIHADQTRGITVSELNSGYWAGVYQAAVRVS